MYSSYISFYFFFFFFNDTATTEIYTLSLHDALPISQRPWIIMAASTSLKTPASISLTLPAPPSSAGVPITCTRPEEGDRKSTRLNSSHDQISYAVFCLKKKKKEIFHSLSNPGMNLHY